jgi:glycolate oxidase
VIEDLARLLGEEFVLHGAAAERGYDCDAYTVDRSRPAVVVLPKDTEQTAQVIRYCVAHEIPYTARGAGTGLSGGVLPAMGGVVISTKRLTQILEIDVENRAMRAQAGVPNRKLSDAVKHAGLHFAPDPSSQTVSTLGGNIGENAGGPHTLKYGVTAPHILGVTMVEPGGDIVTFGGPSEGMPGFEFVGLIVGSEGTLGVVTEAWIKLTPIPTAVSTALAAFDNVRAATEAVAEIIKSGVIPAALEMMDHGILHALRLAFGLEYPAGTQALLLVECDGNNAAKVTEEMAQVASICTRLGSLSFVEATDEAARQRLWTARKKGVGAMGRIAPTVVTHDGVIPRSKLPEMLDTVYAVSAEFDIGVANIFHAGDGNLHPCFYFDDRDPDQVRRVVAAGEKVIHRCLELGGSVTGEHGIGVEKLDLMAAMFTPEDLEYQAMAKRIFSDGRLCNPCKVLPNQKSCTEHRKRWRGMAW